MVLQISTGPTVLNIIRKAKLAIYSMPKFNRKANVK
jgi:hypothetical protein